MLRAAGVGGQIITLSNNASDGFVKALGDQARGVLVTQVFPSERSISYPLIKKALTPAMVEGYANAKVLVEGLRRAGPKPGRAQLHTALETLNRYDLGGLELGCSSTDHTGLDFADLSIIGVDGRFQR